MSTVKMKRLSKISGAAKKPQTIIHKFTHESLCIKEHGCSIPGNEKNRVEFLIQGLKL